MCVASKRTGQRSSRGFQMSGSGPLRKTAVNAEGSFAQKGAATGFKVGGKVYENKAEATAVAQAAVDALNARNKASSAGRPITGFSFTTPMQKVEFMKEGPVRGARGRQAGTVSSSLSKGEAARTVVTGITLAERKAQEGPSAKARPASAAPSPTAPAAAPTAATPTPRKRQTFRIRPGSSANATASFGRSGVNVPN